MNEYDYYILKLLTIVIRLQQILLYYIFVVDQGLKIYSVN